MTLEELAESMRTMPPEPKIVICGGGERLKAEALVLRYGMDHLWTVRESRYCPVGKLLLINDPHTDAGPE